jgi:hypothetical protein
MVTSTLCGTDEVNLRTIVIRLSFHYSTTIERQRLSPKPAQVIVVQNSFQNSIGDNPFSYHRPLELHYLPELH